MSHVRGPAAQMNGGSEHRAGGAHSHAASRTSPADDGGGGNGGPHGTRDSRGSDHDPGSDRERLRTPYTLKPLHSLLYTVTTRCSHSPIASHVIRTYALSDYTDYQLLRNRLDC